MEELPLEGILVAVPATRRAAETEALIRRWGGTCLVGPLLEEVPVEDEAALRSATEEVIGTPATWSVHLTGAGARLVEVAPYRGALPAEPARREAAEAVVRSIAAAEVQALVVTSAVQATNLFSVARDLGVEDDLRRSLGERIFTAAVGEVSKASL